jgi:SAM-dependent methyltransferase
MPPPSEHNALATEATVHHESYACVCGETACTRRRVLAKDPYSGEKFTYTACRACGLERMVERPGVAAIGRYYPTSYGCYKGVPTRQQVSLTDRLKALVYRTYYDPSRAPGLLMRWLLWPIRRRSVMAFRPPASRRVFEFGAGCGGDLVTFCDAGWEATGCEPSAQACATAASHGLSLQNCLAEEAEIPSGTSCIFMNNVFEHLYDPPAILSKIHHALTDDGVLVLIVPNHDCWSARVFGAAWPGYDAPRHIWGWTPQSITNALARAGFAIEYINQQAPVNLWSATLARLRGFACFETSRAL